MKHVNRQWDVTQLVEQLILTAKIHSLNPVHHSFANDLLSVRPDLAFLKGLNEKFSHNRNPNFGLI